MDQQQPQSHTEHASQVGELDHPGARDLLATETLARLAYAGSDGFPRVIPIGFHWTGEHIVVCTVPSSPKVRAMAARPDIALTIDTDQGTASRFLSVRGVAAIEIVDGVPDEYLAASTKKMDDEQARQFEAAVRSMYEQMARITIQPRWARYYDFGTGRGHRASWPSWSRKTRPVRVEAV